MRILDQEFFFRNTSNENKAIILRYVYARNVHSSYYYILLTLHIMCMCSFDRLSIFYLLIHTYRSMHIQKSLIEQEIANLSVRLSVVGIVRISLIAFFHFPSKFFSAFQAYCSRLSVALLSYDSRSTRIRLDCIAGKNTDGLAVQGRRPNYSYFLHFMNFAYFCDEQGSPTWLRSKSSRYFFSSLDHEVNVRSKGVCSLVRSVGKKPLPFFESLPFKILRIRIRKLLRR